MADPVTAGPGLTLAAARACALEAVDGVPEGDPLDVVTAALVSLGVRATATALDVDGVRIAVERALDLGATPAEVHGTLVLVSGIGVHTLMAGSAIVAAALRERGAFDDGPLDARRQALWDAHVGGSSYWGSVEVRFPGFLDGLLRQSPEAFAAYFAYCAVPAQTGDLRPLTRELVSLAADATSSHRFLPGLLLHVDGAVRCGAGRRQVREALDIAASAPEHQGVGGLSR